MERYLMLEHPNQDGDPQAETGPGDSAPYLPDWLTPTVWDERDLNRERVHKLCASLTEGDGVLLVGDTAFAKPDRQAVGVARQYSGTLGQVVNCQVMVNCHYAEPALAWPVDVRLYLPKFWCDDPARRAAGQIPDEVEFQTKPEIALTLIDEALSLKVPHHCIVVEAEYGDNPQFLNGLESRGERYVVGVRANFRVTLAQQAEALAQRVEDVLRALPRRQWQTIGWREGRQDWLRAKFVAVRGWRVDGAGPRQTGWLIGQRPNGGSADWQYFWSNLPPDMPLAALVEYIHRRYWVEQFHEKAKRLLGWDHHPGRVWHAFHRNAVLVMLSYSCLAWLEWQERQRLTRRGPPAGAFSRLGLIAGDQRWQKPIGRALTACANWLRGKGHSAPTLTNLTKPY